MKKIRILNKSVISTILVLLIILGTLPITSAAGTQVNFPLIADDGATVSDANTLYVVEVSQDSSKMITATVVVYNRGTTATHVLGGIGFGLFFTDRVAPYQYDPTNLTDPHTYNASRMFLNQGLSYDQKDIFDKYCYVVNDEWRKAITTRLMQNNTGGRFIGAMTSTTVDANMIRIAPGGSAQIAKMFFMPVDGQETLNSSMFRFQYLREPQSWAILSTWIGNGSRLVVSNINDTYPGCTYVLSGATFKLHFAQQPPTGLAVDQVARTVTGYSSTTMEWSTDGTTYRSDVAPIVEDAGHDIYVRLRETAYTSDNPEYGDYKKYLASEPVILTANPNFYSCADDVSLTKTAANLTPHADGKARVGDTVEYTVIAKNDGNPLSTWANAVMTDTIPTGLTFTNVVRLNGTILLSNQYTFTGGVLTVPLGDIPGGGTQKTVTFQATVNDDAYGLKIINSVKVAGKDGNTNDDVIKETDDGGVNGDGGIDVADKSKEPAILPVTEGDNTINGTGEPGARVVVTLPDGTTLDATVAPDGTWSVDVTGKEPRAGDKIKAVQTEPGKDPSPEVETTVLGRPDVTEVKEKTSENKTRNDGTRRVGDTLIYKITVGNGGLPKSLWENVIIEDTLPTEVTYVDGSVKIDGVAVGAPVAAYSAGKLTVNLGNIPGGVTKEVTFEAIINDTAYGKVFVNTAIVDGKPVVEGPDDPPPVFGRTPKPDVDEVNDGDRFIEGDGIDGAMIEVTFPDGVTKVTGPVTGGRWRIPVPSGINLVEGNIIKVTQTKAPDDASEPVEAIVGGKKPVDPRLSKTTENLTSTDGKTRVGDRIKYTVTVSNYGSPKSYWTSAVLTDFIPDGLNLDVTTVKLDGQSPTYSSYSNTTKLLSVTIWFDDPGYRGIQGGTSAVITFECDVAPNAHGKHIKNSVSVNGYQNGGTTDADKVGKDADEDGGGYTIQEQSEVPEVFDITKGDREINGKGKPGAQIVVELPNGQKLPPVTVDNNGDWTVPLPNTAPDLVIGDVVTVVQIEPDKDPSDEVKKTVKDTTGRSLHGLVWPVVDRDWDMGQTFLDMHAVTVELRDSFLSPAVPGTVVKAVLTTDNIGEFTIPNVPFGDYVLVITRPGYLVRCMNISITANDPDTIELEPPASPADEKGVFRLWWGSCTGRLRIDSLDIMMVTELTDVSVYSPKYVAACDMNADGIINSFDVMMVVENADKTARQYAGAGNVDFNA